MDHVQGLFLRWGVGAPIPVFGPPDPEGCDDLFKHPGLLDFSHTVEPFVVFTLQVAGDAATAQSLEADLRLSAGVGAQPGSLVVGYRRITGKTLKFLLNNQPQAIVIDCSHEPRPQPPRNHCDLNTVRAINRTGLPAGHSDSYQPPV